MVQRDFRYDGSWFRQQFASTQTQWTERCVFVRQDLEIGWIHAEIISG